MDQLPEAKFPEFAFIGRSNVGKSSLINMLVQQKELAKTSSTPGKTKTFNHFLINNSWYLADLPGYGFARVARTERENWNKKLNEYLKKRDNLMYVLVLVDSRLEPQKSDLEFINKTGMNGIPLAVVFTKSDKEGTADLNRNIAVYKKKLLEFWEELPPLFITSAEDGRGREELLKFISDSAAQFKNAE